MKLHFLCVLILSIFSYANGQFRFVDPIVGISLNDIYTKAECEALANNDVLNAYNAIDGSMAAEVEGSKFTYTVIEFKDQQAFVNGYTGSQFTYIAGTSQSKYVKGCNLREQHYTFDSDKKLQTVWWDDVTGFTAALSLTSNGDSDERYHALVKLPSVPYSSLDGVGTSWKLTNSSGHTLADSDLVSCNSDGNFIDGSGNLLYTQCEAGYRTEDYGLIYIDPIGFVNPTTAYSCNSSLHVIVAESGFCQTAGCKDSDASNYDSTVVYKDLIIVNDVRYDSCQYADCAAYQTSKITGVCLVDGRPEFDGDTNNLKTSGCSAGATTCSHVSAVTDLDGVKINGDNDAYCLQGELVDGSAATATQACDTANYYFKNGDPANGDAISGYTCDGTTINNPEGIITFTYFYSPSTPSSFNNGVSGDCTGECWEEHKAMCYTLYEELNSAFTNAGTDCGLTYCDSAAALSYVQTIGFNTNYNSLQDQDSPVKYIKWTDVAYVNREIYAMGCSISRTIDMDNGNQRVYDVRWNGYTSSKSCGDGGKGCVKAVRGAPELCEGKNAGVTAAMIAASDLDGTETCETGSPDFDLVTCATNYETSTGETTSTGYGCLNGEVAVSSTGECLAKCSAATVTGYSGTPTNLFKNTFDGTNVVCATDFHGTASVGTCSEAGAVPEYSGCDADTCTSTLPSGYAFDGTPVLSKFNLEVTLQCTETHLQTTSFSADCGGDGQDLSNVAGCLPKATIDATVSVGTDLQSGGNTVDTSKLVCDGSSVRFQDSVGSSVVVDAVCKDGYGSSDLGVQCDSNNNIVNTGNACSPKCNEPGSDVVYDVADGNPNTKTVSFRLCHADGGSNAQTSKVNSMYIPDGCSQNADGDWEFNEYEDPIYGNPSAAPCNAAHKCKQYSSLGYNFDATAISTLVGSVSLTGFTCADGYSGDPVATCNGVGQDLVYSGCSKTPDCTVSSNALLSECMCGATQCGVGKYCDIDGCSDYKSCPVNFYTAVVESQLTSPSDDGYQYRTDGGLGDFSVTEDECKALAGSNTFQVLQADANNNAEPTGCGYWENGDGTTKIYRYNYNPSSTITCGTNIASQPVQCVSKPQASCQCGSDVALEGDYCALNSDGNRQKSTLTPCSAGAGSNSEACYCPTSSSSPRLGSGTTCTPTSDSAIYCYDTDNNNNMECTFDELNKPDDFMLEDPGETTTNDVETWSIAHANCGEGKFSNIKRQSTLGFDCVPCDRSVFLNNYNTPYGVKATNVDGKDVLKRESSLDDHQNVVHGRCCVNSHHSVCAQMIREYKLKCESTLVMSNGVIQDEVSKGTGVQCLASDDVNGDYDCVLGPGDAVCQNGGTPTGKMVSTGCTCTCPSGYSGSHCEVDDNAPAPTCANDVAISDTCSCQGADRTDGVCKNSGANYHPLCVNEATLASMAGDTCACWDGVSGTSPDIAYKNDANADTLTCTNGNIA